MKPATLIACMMLIASATAWSQQTQPDAAALQSQLRAAQLDLELASARLALVQVQSSLQAGRPAEARVYLTEAQRVLASIERQTDVSAYRQVAERLARDVTIAEDAQRRMTAAAPPPVTTGPPVVHAERPVLVAEPPVVIAQPPVVVAQPPIAAGPACVSACQCGAAHRSACSCKICPPVPMPDLQAQAEIAADQVRIAREQGYTNVAGSRIEMIHDPEVIKQRTLDHQTRWDMGRYAPARELIDIGVVLELDLARIHYQGTLYRIRDGAIRDQLLHVLESTIPPPYVMNYPDDWRCIEEARARYADGKVWESEPFVDTDGQTRTVAVYDVADLLFVPIFPGPSEYNVLAYNVRDPVRYWAGQERLKEELTHPAPLLPYYYGYGYGYGVVPPAPPVLPPLQAGQPAPANGQAQGAYYGVGSYNGYRVTDIIGTASYYPFEADPIYQYRLAQKRSQLLRAVSRMMETVRD